MDPCNGAYNTAAPNDEIHEWPKVRKLWLGMSGKYSRLSQAGRPGRPSRPGGTAWLAGLAGPAGGRAGLAGLAGQLGGQPGWPGWPEAHCWAMIKNQKRFDGNVRFCLDTASEII